MSDEEVITIVLNGETHKYSSIINKYQSRMFHTALGMVGVKEDAEEIVQDAFIKAFYKLSTFEARASFSTWLYRIVINLCLNHLQKKKFRRLVDIDLLWFLQSSDSNPQEKLEQKNLKENIEMAIGHLPSKQKTCFILSKFNDLSQKEIASIMRCSEGSVEQLLIRAKKNLKKKLQKVL